MTTEFSIDSVNISNDEACYVIAEIGNNHQGNIDIAKKMIIAAKEAGCNAVKFQKRNNHTLYTKAMFNEPYNSENSFADTYGRHREVVELSKDEFRELRDFSLENEITFFSTVFDIESADILEELDMPAYKIASSDLTNIPLLRHIASFGKPMIISTGGALMEDVEMAYEFLHPINQKICILQCTSSYPVAAEELDLRVIETYRQKFPDCVIGFSGHDNGIAMALVAYMLGACVVEKHFTLDRTMKGTDNIFSLTPDGMRRMVRDLKRAQTALGDGVKKKYDSESAPMYKMSKKLVASRDLKAGHILQSKDIAIKIPGDGLPPCKYDDVVGKKLVKDIIEEENITLELLSD